MTIKEAKRLCKLANGRLPRVGHEMAVLSEIVPMEDYWPFLAGNYRQITYLVNDSGKFRVRQYTSVNPEKES